VKKLENIERAVGFIFSRCGFTKDAEDYCKEKGIAYSEDSFSSHVSIIQQFKPLMSDLLFLSKNTHF
jgi:hypothetical protein